VVGSGEAAYERMRQIALVGLLGLAAAIDTHNQFGFVFFGFLVFLILVIVVSYAKKLPYFDLKLAIVQLGDLIIFILSFFLVAVITSIGNNLMSGDGTINWKTVVKLLLVFLTAVSFFIVISRFFPRLGLLGHQ
jgi:uncharacterized membrane protein